MHLKVAVVGSGVAGLSTAWYLGKQHHVTLFEKKPSVGMGSEGFELQLETGAMMRMDIPPRVINRAHYKSMFQLLDEAGIETYLIKQHPSFSTADGNAYLGFSSLNFKDWSLSVPKPSVATGVWLLRHGPELIKWFKLINESTLDELDSQLDLRSFLQQQGFSERFINGFLYPLWALICTCDYQNLDRFPVRDMLVILRNFSGRAPSLRIKGGTASFEEKMKQRIATPKFSESVQQISTGLPGNKVQIKTDKGDYDFDHVIVATEPYFAAKMLDQSFARERALIEEIPWYETTMVLHKDLDLMPKQRRMWSPVNLFWDPKQDRSWATLWMNQLEFSDPHSETLLQSWDPGIPPKDESILATRTFKRVLATKKSQKIVNDLNHAMSSEPQRRLWFVGAYMTDNIPLLENGVATARKVAEWITQQAPQTAEPYSKRNTPRAKAVNR